MKLLAMLTALVTCATCIAQPFIGLLATNRGVGAQAGVLADGIEITAAIKAPFTHNDVATIISLTVGKQFLLTTRPTDNYSVSAHIGVANYRVQDFTAYNADQTGQAAIVQVSEIKPAYSMQLGKDSYLGRVFISGTWCGAMYYGIGLKIFTHRN